MRPRRRPGGKTTRSARAGRWADPPEPARHDLRSRRDGRSRRSRRRDRRPRPLGLGRTASGSRSTMRACGARSCPACERSHPDLDLAHERLLPQAARMRHERRVPRASASGRSSSRKWFVCQGCQRLARAGDQFELHKGRYRHQCAGNKFSRAVPVRFVAACARGHLIDFPWRLFAHRERKEGICDRPDLRLEEGATGDLARIRFDA